MKIAVVYIARLNEGFKCFREFVDSYRKHPAGCEHELLIVFKGFSLFGAKSYIKYLGDLKYNHTFVHDKGYDLGTYKIVANMPECAEYNVPEFDTMLCLNSHSEILVDGWLEKYTKWFSPTVAFVSATCSSESFCKKWWHNIFFKSFPNNHFRTNAFLIGRKTLLKVWPKFGFWSKMQCYLFESGRNNLRIRINKLGLCSVALTSNFRKGNQEGLVIADKQTKAFASADIDEKFRLRELAWGVEN